MNGAAARPEEFAMKTLILLSFVIPAFASAVAGQTEKCFVNEADGFERVLRFTIDGRAVKGQLAVSRINSEAPTRMYEFTGPASKANLTFTFADGKVPDVFPEKGTRLKGIFAGSDLELKLSSLVHDRGWRDVYSARYRACS